MPAFHLAIASDGLTVFPMSKLPLLIVVLVLGFSPGCRLAHNLWLTSVSEPIHYARNLDEKLSKREFEAMAEAALAQERAVARAERDNYACEPFSIDHELGFTAGFSEYLSAGGTGEPPPLPPRKYWRRAYQNPVGQQQINDWFDGYRHGVAVAVAGNYRSYVVVPLSDAPIINTEQTTYGRITAAPPEDNAPEELPNSKVASSAASEVRPTASSSRPVVVRPTISHLPPLTAPESDRDQ